MDVKNKQPVKHKNVFKNMSRPTHFLSIPITSDYILGYHQNFSLYIQESQNKFLKLLIPQSKLHITLGLLHLPTSNPDLDIISRIVTDVYQETIKY